jgi:hypothetical protein
MTEQSNPDSDYITEQNNLNTNQVTEGFIILDESSCITEASNATLGYIDATKTDWTLQIPEMSEWQCWLIGDGSWGTVIHPKKGDEPNWFHRWMQRMAFGFRWEKVNK